MKQAQIFVLAGGEGQRMRPLTNLYPKPLLRLGPAARLMDFTLYNSLVAGAAEVSVLTQYRGEMIERYLEEKWMPAFADRGSRLTVLPAAQGELGLYSGTADALDQALDRTAGNPEYVIVLAADQVYRMDYRPLLDFHRRHGLAATVPARDQENPFSRRGVYVFTRAAILPYLEQNRDEASHDLDQDIFPRLVADGQAGSFPFVGRDGAPGFWRDVDNLASYWRAQIALIEKSADFRPAEAGLIGLDPSPDRYYVSERWGEEQWIHRSLIADTARIGEAMVEDSVIGPGAVIEDGAVVQRSVILDGAVVSKWTELDSALVGPGLKITQLCRPERPSFPLAIPAARPLADPSPQPLRAAGIRPTPGVKRAEIMRTRHLAVHPIAFHRGASNPTAAAASKH